MGFGLIGQASACRIKATKASAQGTPTVTATTWKIAFNGNRATAADWSTDTVPGSADDVTIDVSGTPAYSVTVTKAESAHSLTVDAINATLSLTGTLRVGRTLDGAAETLSLESGGSLTAGGNTVQIRQPHGRTLGHRLGTVPNARRSIGERGATCGQCSTPWLRLWSRSVSRTDDLLCSANIGVSIRPVASTGMTKRFHGGE